MQIIELPSISQAPESLIKVQPSVMGQCLSLRQPSVDGGEEKPDHIVLDPSQARALIPLLTQWLAEIEADPLYQEPPC